MIRTEDPLERFQLKPVKPAIVSEISETTAASSVPPEERVNFHIGNPVQDLRLSSSFMKIILQLPEAENLTGGIATGELIKELDLETAEKSKLEFFDTLIKRSAPYLLRGGYAKNKPTYLINSICEWFEKDQHDSLSYDLGGTTGKREIILSSGGITESVRIFFHSLSEYLINKPAKIFSFGADLPKEITTYQGLHFEKGEDNESFLTERLESHFNQNPSQASFLIIGTLLSEKARRTLRKISLENPLFFVEINNAPNNLSLAREAKMINRVLRFLTPGIFSEKLSGLSIVFIAGNPDFVKIIETIHFQLKGTPSASESELLTFILKEKFCPDIPKQKTDSFEPDIQSDELSFPFNVNPIDKHLYAGISRISETVSSASQKINSLLKKTSLHEERINKASESVSTKFGFDPFHSVTAGKLLDELIANINSDNWQTDLCAGFLYSFVKHHPEYSLPACSIVSGSSRTGLGLIGFHCGIREVIIPDLSWTYEHCFPNVITVPLASHLELDINSIIKTAKNRISSDPKWKTFGAVALNNPHNATGQEFNSVDIKKLIKWLLQNNIFVIDDLSYQNVTPSNELKLIKTIKQLALELHAEGYITDENLTYVITVHSVSKTDCLAGARLSVIEIMHKELKVKFDIINSLIKPNIGAILLAYLFYRNENQTVNYYWLLRNRIFKERMDAIIGALTELPEERNPFRIGIKAPTGSMYPLMVISNLPDGLSLEWLASGLSRQGIGLLPLSAFARTQEGFDTGRKTFRLTLGGPDSAEILSVKTRRILIDINKMIAEESANYIRKTFSVKPISLKNRSYLNGCMNEWNRIEKIIRLNNERIITNHAKDREFRNEEICSEELKSFFSERLNIFRQRFADRSTQAYEIVEFNISDKGNKLSSVLESEFFKSTLTERENRFKNRLYDRTVHPTQMFSLQVELGFEELIKKIIRKQTPSDRFLNKLSEELLNEFLGLNVSISSKDESDELVLDLGAIIPAENFINIHSDHNFNSLISFWSDWDGSTRPSGQGHRLAATIVIENVIRQAEIIKLLYKFDKSINIEPGLLLEINRLKENNQKFIRLLNEITFLTHQLEKKYKGILPFNVKAGIFRQAGMKLHIASDPLTSLWRHNNRFERKMLELRQSRKTSLEHYFSLNKQLRKTLHSLLPDIIKNISNRELALEASLYRDLLKRFTITPRIHQKMITSQDPFAVDTTVHNINEINDIAGRYGNSGMILGLQISMSTKPEALISLDRKMRSVKEQFARNNGSEPNSVWIIPLFEEVDAVKNIKNYLNKIWEYSLQSRKINQATGERFSEIMAEVFIAGSDLSQQVSQTAGMELYKGAKHETVCWLAEKGLIASVRMKMGSGEPMQRQGGYYSNTAGQPAFIKDNDSGKRFSNYLNQSTIKSAQYASTPLLGVFSGGDLRTFQSNISEKLRNLPMAEFAQLLFHLNQSQNFYKSELIRAGEPLVDTRLQFQSRGLKEIKRLTIGKTDESFIRFVKILTDNFREILYGKEEDVIGIHIISYFISRTTPSLRDRPATRPADGGGENAGQRIIGKIADTIPFSKHGSLLRAISHNQSQTAVIGFSQLTTGLFRALDSFSQKQFAEGEPLLLITERILPNLPVYEILQSLRIYHDPELQYINRIEEAFPAGNSSFAALREDADAIKKYLVFFQKELLRRHGINPADFFDRNGFIPYLLPTLRPDLAVLLQQDIFNSDYDLFMTGINGNISPAWILEVRSLLKGAQKIKEWRAKAWSLLERPVFIRVKSFVELAIALNQLSAVKSKELVPFPKKVKVPHGITNFFNAYSDDNIQQFIGAAVEYLSAAAEGTIEVPTNIIKALREVETIIRIEEQALTPKEQKLLRYYLLQIARIAGENG